MELKDDILYRINYQILIDEMRDADGWYTPDYRELISGASSREEVKYIKKVKSRGTRFHFNLIYITKQKCGHYEIFQVPMESAIMVKSILREAEIEARNRMCTSCICG